MGETVNGGSQESTHPEPCRLTLVCRLSCTPNPGSSLIDTLGRVSSSIFNLEERWSGLVTPTYTRAVADPDQQIPGMVHMHYNWRSYPILQPWP